jgi:bla regulator protein BlaR1
MRLAGAVAAAMLLAGSAVGQTFDVASVKINKTDNPPNANFPLGPGDVYVPNGGLFSATGFPLVTYLFFAYKVIGNQGQYLLPQLPAWATTEKYDIQARAEGNPGKDQMRMLMRGLLADRFKLAMHTEKRELPVLALVLAKHGKTGPQLQAHPAGADCPINVAEGASPTATVAGGFPVLCNGIFGMPASTAGRVKIGARNLTLKFLADSLSAGANRGRPMTDQTGLTGTFDFTLEYTPEINGTLPPGATFQPDPSGPTLEEALREQLGIKLESSKTTMEVLVLDHVERPSEN